MAFMEFAGCALTAYSPALALFILTVSHDPVRIIIMVTSAFFWLVALVVSSLFWNFITFGHLMPLCVLFSVAIQEVFRYCFYKLMRKTEEGLRSLRVPNTNTDMLKNRHLVPYVAGLGYGAMSGVFSLFNILAALSGPATVGFPDPVTGASPSPYYAFFTAVFTMLFTMLHTVWSVVFFDAADEARWLRMAWVVCSHAVVSCLTLLHVQGLYAVSFPLTVLVLAISSYMAYRSVTTGPTN
ncbi:unnamed protein product [Nesidiocoris tenuis]|uniref:Gamma-secretase subunit n=2 Tax=Nesidiocoris tenuis TaxID=355587 RepID=A0ABN7AWN7_9HEMI|nr:Gamma-secretase subunit [Nesidiocoris tenuis]CAB0019448.1 unnamed protein product [Nesidiocoris tenuis]